MIQLDENDDDKKINPIIQKCTPHEKECSFAAVFLPDAYATQCTLRIVCRSVRACLYETSVCDESAWKRMISHAQHIYIFIYLTCTYKAAHHLGHDGEQPPIVWFTIGLLATDGLLDVREQPPIVWVTIGLLATDGLLDVREQPPIVWVTIGLLATDGLALQLKLKRADKPRERDRHGRKGMRSAVRVQQKDVSKRSEPFVRNVQG
eukprot:1158266-Pelagomonas_calceolata.AAC.11